MPLEARLLVGLSLAMAIVYAATPVAIRLAAHFDFYDTPIGYKGHAAPTPYLGGAAVITGFVVAVLALTSDARQTLPVLGGVVVLWAVGTLDDRRLVAVVAAAVGGGRARGDAVGGGAGLVARARLCRRPAARRCSGSSRSSTRSTSSTTWTAPRARWRASSLRRSPCSGSSSPTSGSSRPARALCGACLGFLPHNLSRPSARIFLGDGGSMPIGFAIAALVMIGASSAAAEWQALVMGLLLVGVPALDTCLVMVSRRRRGVSILTGGRDHLTHRTRARLRTARASVAALGAGQALLAALALVAVQGGPQLLVPVVLAYLVAMAALIAVLDAEPAGAAVAAPSGDGLAAPSEQARVRAAPGRARHAEPGEPARASTWPGLAVLLAARGRVRAEPVRGRLLRRRRSGRPPASGC